MPAPPHLLGRLCLLQPGLQAADLGLCPLGMTVSLPYPPLESLHLGSQGRGTLVVGVQEVGLQRVGGWAADSEEVAWVER